jgi:hypothetical protein
MSIYPYLYRFDTTTTAVPYHILHHFSTSLCFYFSTQLLLYSTRLYLRPSINHIEKKNSPQPNKHRVERSETSEFEQASCRTDPTSQEKRRVELSNESTMCFSSDHKHVIVYLLLPTYWRCVLVSTGYPQPLHLHPEQPCVKTCCSPSLFPSTLTFRVTADITTSMEMKRKNP